LVGDGGDHSHWHVELVDRLSQRLVLAPFRLKSVRSLPTWAGLLFGAWLPQVGTYSAVFPASYGLKETNFGNFGVRKLLENNLPAVGRFVAFNAMLRRLTGTD
jgi:hypothetical protein